MTDEEWKAEFVREMCRQAEFEHFDDGTAVEEYAEDVAQSYCDTRDEYDTPGDAAEADISYWGEE